MQTADPSTVLVFEDVEFDVVDIHNVPWLRGPQVGDALGYKKGRISIHKLFESNADEFTDQMCRVVELDTAGGRQQVRIFSPRGCYLLGMLARTERAKAFRVWVLDVLEGRLLPQCVGRLTVHQQLSALRYRGALLKDLAATTQLGLAGELYANLHHVSRLLSMPVGKFDALAPLVKPLPLVG